MLPIRTQVSKPLIYLLFEFYRKKVAGNAKDMSRFFSLKKKQLQNCFEAASFQLSVIALLPSAFKDMAS
jgi:hypothetical protein